MLAVTTSAFIIAGGRSTRMGRDKALLRIGDAGPTLLERAIELARSVAEEVRIVGQKEMFESWIATNPTHDSSVNPTLRQNRAKGWATPNPGPGSGPSNSTNPTLAKTGLGWGTRGIVEDIFPGQGPLAGIHAALRASASELNLMLALDTPFIEPRFLRYLVDEAAKGGAVITVPVVARPETRVPGDRARDSGLATRDVYQPLCAVYRRSFADIAEAALLEGRNNIVPLFKQVSTRVIAEDELRKLAFEPRMFDNLNTPEEWDEALRRARNLKLEI